MELSEIINDFISEIEEAAVEAANHALDFGKLTFSFSSAPKLFHYCSLESFYNIIESNCFWLSHPKFMNDTSEYRYSIQTTKNFVYEYNQNITKNDASKDFFKLVESSVNEYEFGFKRFDENKYEKLNFFTCFTSDGDNLPMWSIYKGKNIGISIGLDFKNKDYFVKPQEHTGNNAQEVSPFLNFPNAFFTDIEYDKEKTKQTIYIFLNHIKNYYNAHLTEFNNFSSSVNKICSEEVVRYLINMSNYLKNSNYSYEKETRFFLRKYEQENVKFRVRDKFIVPYIEFPLEEDENKKNKKIDKPVIPIFSITVSPNAGEPDLVIASIRAFLNHKGYNIDKITIEQSPIPFKYR